MGKHAFEQCDRIIESALLQTQPGKLDTSPGPVAAATQDVAEHSRRRGQGPLGALLVARVQTHGSEHALGIREQGVPIADPRAEDRQRGLRLGPRLVEAADVP